LKRYSKKSNQRLREVLISLNFKATPNQMRVVRLLMEKPTTKTKVAEEVKVSKNTVFYMLEKFESCGMLKYEPNFDDMRSQFVTLSKDFRNKI
jgi:DNA-binding MarR family transcriptional regulator